MREADDPLRLCPMVSLLSLLIGPTDVDPDLYTTGSYRGLVNMSGTFCYMNSVLQVRIGALIFSHSLLPAPSPSSF